ncbi:MAG TPA: hypothetical protein VH500_25430 [Nitrososphaeraceae archaeon]|jgi:hypothetical protein
MGTIRNDSDRKSSICIFCKRTIEIEFDLELHLYKQHRMELVCLRFEKDSLDDRIDYAIKEGNKVTSAIKHLDKKDKMKLGFCSYNLEGANF